MVLIAAGQLCSSSSLTANGKLAVQLIEKAVQRGVEILFLPEASDYIAKSMDFSKKLVKPVETNPFIVQIQQKLQSLYQSGKFIQINVGIHEPSSKSDRVLNTSIWFNSKGEIIHRYQKIHLFDVNIPNGAIIQESQGVEPGCEILKPFSLEDIPDVKIGLGICYDLRFPELALRLRSLGANILSFPSAFTLRTGAAHWHLLGRARAIDTQSYVVMAAQTGGHITLTDEDIDNNKIAEPATRFSYGHSIIIDPWGSVIAEVSDIDTGSDLAVAEVDLELIQKTRINMPLWEQRRSDVFGYQI